MADQIRTAVVGTGYFGRFHANHYTKNPDAKLVCVVDSNPERAKAMAEEFGAEAVTDHREIYDKVDAVSVAVPTPFHFDVARDLIEAKAAAKGNDDLLKAQARIWAAEVAVSVPTRLLKLFAGSGQGDNITVTGHPLLLKPAVDLPVDPKIHTMDQ